MAASNSGRLLPTLVRAVGICDDEGFVKFSSFLPDP